MFKKATLLYLFLAAVLTAQVTVKGPEKEHATSFAIVVDKATYDKTNGAVDAYKKAVENDGLSAYVIVSDWKKPEEIKTELVKLYKGDIPLEGAVFVGDIPMPMVKNAQYMTSAFKLDEVKYPIDRAAVPTDRFYDDFDLKFNFIEQDSSKPLNFYYALAPDSPMRIEKDIYSARIKAPVNDESKYGLIEKYLRKVAAQKEKEEVLDNMFVFTGHGYYSNSMTAWGDERIPLQEQFPQMFRPGGRIKNLHNEMSHDMKEILLVELQKEELDMAVFHAHGAPEIQYVIDYPDGSNVASKIEDVKLYLRSKLRTQKRRNKSVEEAKEYFKKEYGVPDEWFEGAFVDSVIAADSVLEYSLDIYSEDIAKVKPQAKFVIFDECFNGSYHQENYIAGQYLFGDGATVAGEANSVNVLQDKWPDEYLGLINKGVRIGLWHKQKNLLESHILGDPTFHYSQRGPEDLNKMLVVEKENTGAWERLLDSDDPVYRAAAVTYLFKNKGKSFEKELEDIYMNDASANVRLHALKYLGLIDGEGFATALKTSINDPYELIRRFSATWMGETGKEEFIPYLISAIIYDESERVSFNAKTGVSFIDTKGAIEEAKKAISEMPDSKVLKEQLSKVLLNSLKRNDAWLNDELIPHVTSDTLALKWKKSEMRTFRNYNFHEGIPTIISVAKDKSQDEQLRIMAIEALGWFTISNRKDEIISACDYIIKNESDQDIRNEAIRTKNRLVTGLNHPVIL